MSKNREKVRGYIAENFLFGQDDGFSDDASFLEMGIIDSTGILELVSYLEETFGIAVGDEELIPENLDSLNAICSYLDKKQAFVASS
jgi:acyl carrier protein